MEGYLRLSFATATETLTEALDRLLSFAGAPA
jgi:aspartate/methionine/tyrosine aminotransferase